MTLLRIAIGLGAVAALGCGVLAVALCRSAARRDAIAAQQRRHRHPSSFDRDTDTALAVASATSRLCSGCADIDPAPAIDWTGIDATGNSVGTWRCGRCGWTNYFSTPLQITPRRGK